MMSDTLAQMREILGTDSSPLSGRCLRTQRINPLLLVIENLASLGFRTADCQAGLDKNHCLIAIRNLARFHASSVALFERDPDQKSRYIRGLFDKSQSPKFWIVSSIEPKSSIKKLLVGRNLLQKFQRNYQNSQKKSMRTATRPRFVVSEFNVLSHFSVKNNTVQVQRVGPTHQTYIRKLPIMYLL